MTSPRQILLVSGSTRSGSTNTAVLRTAQALAPEGVTAELYGGLADLPAFNPDNDHRRCPPAVAQVRQQIRNCDAMLFCTPEYVGALPVSFKNLLDWTVGDDQAGSIYQKPVAWINASSPAGGADAHASPAKVLGYVGAKIVEAACQRLPMTPMASTASLGSPPRMRQSCSGRVRARMRQRQHRADGGSGQERQGS